MVDYDTNWDWEDGHTNECVAAARNLGLDPDECDPDQECWSYLESLVATQK